MQNWSLPCSAKLLVFSATALIPPFTAFLKPESPLNMIRCGSSDGHHPRDTTIIDAVSQEFMWKAEADGQRKWHHVTDCVKTIRSLVPIPARRSSRDHGALSHGMNAPLKDTFSLTFLLKQLPPDL